MIFTPILFFVLKLKFKIRKIQDWQILMTVEKIEPLLDQIEVKILEPLSSALSKTDADTKEASIALLEEGMFLGLQELSHFVPVIKSLPDTSELKERYIETVHFLLSHCDVYDLNAIKANQMMSRYCDLESCGLESFCYTAKTESYPPP